MKFHHFCQNSPNFIKLAEHIGIIIRNMQVKFQHVKFEPFREVQFFHRKMLTVPALEISWNFNIFSKFTNFHQTCRTYWNHHQKHACEIWAYSEKLNFFIEKCLQCRPFRNVMKFQHFFKIHLISSNLQNHIGIIIRNMHVKFEPIQRS